MKRMVLLTLCAVALTLAIGYLVQARFALVHPGTKETESESARAIDQVIGGRTTPLPEETGPAPLSAEALASLSSEERIRRYTEKFRFPERPEEIRKWLFSADLDALEKSLYRGENSQSLIALIAAIIALDTPENAFETLSRFYDGGVTQALQGFEYYSSSKIYSYHLLGLLPPELSACTLISALSKDVAGKRACNFPGTRYDADQLHAIMQLQAANGLLEFRSEAYMLPVRKLYEQFKAISFERRTDFDISMVGGLRGVLATWDMYVDLGPEEAERRIRTIEDPNDMLAIFGQYLEPYLDIELGGPRGATESE